MARWRRIEVIAIKLSFQHGQCEYQHPEYEVDDVFIVWGGVLAQLALLLLALSIKTVVLQNSSAGAVAAVVLHGIATAADRFYHCQHRHRRAQSAANRIAGRCARSVRFLCFCIGTLPESRPCHVIWAICSISKSTMRCKRNQRALRRNYWNGSTRSDASAQNRIAPTDENRWWGWVTATYDGAPAALRPGTPK